jgi:hypothetical protein
VVWAVTGPVLSPSPWSRALAYMTHGFMLHGARAGLNVSNNYKARGRITCDPTPSTRGFLKIGLNGFESVQYLAFGHWLVKRLALFALARGRMDPNVPECLAVRGWRHPNHPTVCTVIRLCTCVGFSRYILCVCQVHSTEVCFVDAETTSLKEENGRRPIFLIFWPIEVS